MRLVKNALMLVSVGILIGALPIASSAVVINEIRIDETGTDYNEYFELRGDPGESLDGLTYIVIGDGTGGSGVIENVTDLTGLVIPADGHFLACESTHVDVATADLVTSLNFENSDNVTHLLVRDFTGANADDLDTDDDCVLDVFPWSAIVDGIALVEEPNPPAATECHYGAEAGAAIGPDGSFVPGQVYRCDTDWYIGAFEFPTDDTPGTANTNCPVGAAEQSWGSLKSRF